MELVDRQVCKRCKKALPATDEYFYRDSKRRFGVNSYCILCIAAKNRDYYKDPEFRARAKARAKRRYYSGEEVKADVKRRAIARQKRLAVENPEAYSYYVYKGTIKLKYRMEPGDYFKMLKEQDGKCGLCFSDNPGKRKKWNIDHDHVTGVVRGLLCNPCNLGLGAYDRMLALAGVQRLERWKERNPLGQTVAVRVKGVLE